MRSIPAEFIAIISKLESQLVESQAREALLAKRLGPAGAEMLRDLVGVIKTLSAALEHVQAQPFDGSWDAQALYVQGVLAETRKIRERVGAG